MLLINDILVEVLTKELNLGVSLSEAKAVNVTNTSISFDSTTMFPFDALRAVVTINRSV